MHKIRIACVKRRCVVQFVSLYDIIDHTSTVVCIALGIDLSTFGFL